MKLSSALIIILFATPVAWAGTPIVSGESLTLVSAILQEERTLLVSLPANYERSTGRFPVLYLTDGNAQLMHTKGTADFLAMNGLIPDLIIVGIVHTDRTRDLTPTKWNSRNRDGTETERPTSGGGPAFLEFFEKELFPFIESNYRTAPYRIFAGHSLGGLLALHALAVRPELFQAYIAVSPSLQWDDGYPLRAIQNGLDGRTELPRTLFVSMANELRDDPSPNRFDRLRTVLEEADIDGFVWEARAMPEEDHGSVVLLSHYWGLRRIFDGWRIAGDEPATLSELTAHYGKLSERLGYPIVPEESVLNLAGYRLLGVGRLDEGIAVLRHNAELYPSSANVYDSLGEALEKAGRLDDAHECYDKAVDLATRSDDLQLQTFMKNRDRLETLRLK